MPTTLKDALQTFVEMNKGLEEAIKNLKVAAKSEGSQRIQEFIGDDKFDMANAVISELDEFMKVEYKSNAHETFNYAEKIIQNQNKVLEKKTRFSEKVDDKQEKLSKLTVVTEDKALSEEEKEVVKTLGYTSISRLKDSKKLIDQKTLVSLAEKGFVELEKISANGEKVLLFELSAKGKLEFETLFGEKPNDSHKAQITEKYNDTVAGFFLFDIVNALQERDYEINEIGLKQIEIIKDGRHTYLTPDFGAFNESDYMKIIDRKNQLKNVGFVCIDERSMRNAEKSIQKWAEENQEKCKFLTVNLTTIDKIENSPNAFETTTY